MCTELMQTLNEDTNASTQTVRVDKTAYTCLSLSLFPLYMLQIMSCNFFVATLCSVIILSQRNPHHGQQVLQ